MRKFGLRVVICVGGLLFVAMLLARLGGQPLDGDLRSVPSDLLRAVRIGSFDRSLVLRTITMILWLCWSVAVLSAFTAALTRGRPTGGLHRLAFVGAVLLGLGSATPVSATPEPTVVPVADESDSTVSRLLSPATIGSSLVAAGLGWMAARWCFGRERETGLSERSDRAKSLLASIRRYDIDGAVAGADAVRRLEGSSPLFLRSHDGRILAVTDEVVDAPAPWKKVATNLVAIDEAKMRTSLGPADRLIVHVGNTEEGEVWCDLERSGSLLIDPGRPESDDIVRALSTSLATSPAAPNVALLVDRESVGPRSIAEFDEATTRSLHDVCPVVRVGSRVDEAATASMVVGRPTSEEVGLRWSGERWELTPLGIPIMPVSLDRAGADSLTNDVETILGATWRSTSEETDPIPHSPHRFRVAILGPPEVIDPKGRRVRFERSKSRELVVWLALHPRIQRRSLARDAMWPVAIKDATFSNITADVRRSMTLASPPPEDEQWLGITLTDELPLHESVECDVDVVRDAVLATRAEPEVHGPRLLKEALELVRGVPFAGTSYGWPDAISLETDAALLVVRAATMLADMCEQDGDTEGVYWATSRGLLAVPGQEDLVLLRMRLHSQRGDTKALQREWENYQRGLILDDGHVLEASPKIRDFVRATKPIRIDGEEGSFGSGFRSEVG